MIPILIFPLFLFLSFAIYGLTLDFSNNVELNNTSSTSSPLSTSYTTTESFLTFLYRASSTNSRRRRQTIFSRPLNTCRSPTATFVHSHCIHNPGMIGSMQSYLVFCREMSGSKTGMTQTPNMEGQQQQPPRFTPAAYRVPRPTAESGRCVQNEICVNGQVLGGWGTSMAWCVGKDRFVRLTETVDDSLRRTFLKDRMGLEAGGLAASAVVSDEKGMTPIKVQELDLAFRKEEDTSGSVSANSSSSSTPVVKTQTCRDCFEIIIPDFVPETNSLTADVRVVGTAVATGILWLAILSG